MVKYFGSKLVKGTLKLQLIEKLLVVFKDRCFFSVSENIVHLEVEQDAVINCSTGPKSEWELLGNITI